MNKDSTIYTVIFTFLIAFIFVLVLSLANSSTQERVELNKVIADHKARLASVGEMTEDDEGNEEVMEAYNNVFGSAEERDGLIFLNKDGRDIIVKGWSGSGLWGTMTGYMAVTSDMSHIVGLEFLSHNETPGLGGRIDEDWFKEQFRGEKIGNGGVNIVPGTGHSDKDKDNSSVDGITGASRTSSSVKKIVNSEIESIKKILGGKE